jgi:hypothetical protein
MWNDLPLPRVEYLNDGREYHISQDQNNFIRIISNRIEDQLVDIVNPVTGKSVGRELISTEDKNYIFLSLKNIKNYFKAPENSYIRNPLLDLGNINEYSLFTNIPINSTSVNVNSLPNYDSLGQAEGDNIRNYDQFINFEKNAFNSPTFPDFDKTPKASNINLPDLETTPKATNTTLPEYDITDFDNPFDV